MDQHWRFGNVRLDPANLPDPNRLVLYVSIGSSFLQGVSSCYRVEEVLGIYRWVEWIDV